MKAFTFALFAVALCLADAGYLGNLEAGASSQTRAQDGLGNYQFAYNEQHTSGGSSRAESGNAHGQVQGHYTLNDADGRQRRVNYVADAAGFRAAIATNEPGTKAQAAASTAINGAAAPVVAEAVIAAPTYAAPQLQLAPQLITRNIVSAPQLQLAAAPQLVTKTIAAPQLQLAAAPQLVAAAPQLVAAAPQLSAYTSSVNHAQLAARTVVSAAPQLQLASQLQLAPQLQLSPQLSQLQLSPQLSQLQLAPQLITRNIVSAPQLQLAAAPQLVTKTIAAPQLQLAAAPQLVAAAPQLSAYTSSVNHAQLAPQTIVSTAPVYATKTIAAPQLALSQLTSAQSW